MRTEPLPVWCCILPYAAESVTEINCTVCSFSLLIRVFNNKCSPIIEIPTRRREISIVPLKKPWMPLCRRSRSGSRKKYFLPRSTAGSRQISGTHDSFKGTIEAPTGVFGAWGFQEYGLCFHLRLSNYVGLFCTHQVSRLSHPIYCWVVVHPHHCTGDLKM